MTDLRRYSPMAVMLLVALRLAIGWQLLYEGLWKIQTLSTSTPWSSKGYLQNAQGPLRDVFRRLSGDPDDLGWLNEAAVAQRWDAWKERFIRHYQLDEGQIGRLQTMIDGAPAYGAELTVLPEGADFAAAGLEKIISWDADRKQLRIDGRLHLKPSERDRLKDQVADRTGPEYDAYRKALDDAYARSSRLSYKERLRGHLLGNPDNAGLVDGRISELELYRQLIDRYDRKLASAEMSFEYDQLRTVGAEAKSRGQDLVGPVKGMDAELREKALGLLSVSQLKLGPLPEPWSPIRVIDMLTIAGLTILGALLLMGLFTRFAALSAALMVLGFYLAMPPLPGVPEIAGPEHSLVVNKNLIEVFALLALAALPSGTWFGIDAIFRRKSQHAADA